MRNSKGFIGINASMLDERPTGVGIYTYNIINKLSILYKKEDQSELTVFTPYRNFFREDIKIIKISDLLQSSKYGKLAALCRFFWNTFLYPLKAKKFDLVISPTTHGSFSLQNQIITIHDLLSLRYKNISFHQRLYFKYLLPFIISRVKLVIAVSEATKKDVLHFLKCPAEKVQVIYNGYDPSVYHQGQSENEIYKKYSLKNYFLAVGPTYPHKNFEFLIQAYHALGENVRKEYPLVIAGGKKKYLAKLKRLVSDLKLEKEIHFLGYVPTELMPPLYREAFLLIFPSLYEGFGFPLLEAMACGCPVITSQNSSMPEVCGQAALYFDPINKKSLLDAISQIVQNDSLRNELRRKGLHQAQRFSWENSASEWKKVVDNYLETIKS